MEDLPHSEWCFINIYLHMLETPEDKVMDFAREAKCSSSLVCIRDLKLFCNKTWKLLGFDVVWWAYVWLLFFLPIFSHHRYLQLCINSIEDIWGKIKPGRARVSQGGLLLSQCSGVIKGQWWNIFPPSLPVENTIKLKVENSHEREKEVVWKRLMETAFVHR